MDRRAHPTNGTGSRASGAECVSTPTPTRVRLPEPVSIGAGNRTPAPAVPRPSAPSSPAPTDLIAVAMAAALRPMVVEAVRDALAELGVAEPPAEVLDAHEAAAFLKISRPGLYRLQGLRHVIVGSTRRWLRSDLLAFLEARAAQAEP